MRFVLSVLLFFCVLLAAMPSVSAATLAPGSLIKASDAAVYYYANDGKRYVFPTEKTYMSWYVDFSTVQTITDAELAEIQIGGNVTYRPGVRMVKVTTDPRVYAIEGKQLRWVKDEAVATALFGANWAQQVDDIPDAFFVNYLLGADILSSSDYSSTTVRDLAPTIQYVLNGEAPTASPIPAPEPTPTPTPIPVPPSSPPPSPEPPSDTTPVTSALDLQAAASSVLDPEFEVGRNRYTYCDQHVGGGVGTLWVGTFNTDGTFTEYDAHQGQSLDSCLFQINGPEWGRDSSGAIITYVKLGADGLPTLAYAHEDSPDTWSVHLVPNLPSLTLLANAVYPSDTVQASARVLFVAANGVQWRDLAGGPVPGSGGGLVSTAQGFWRWARGSNTIAMLTGAQDAKQLAVFNTDDGSTRQVSSESGSKNNPQIWVDANWGPVIAGAVGTHYEVFQLSTGNKVLTIDSPTGAPMQSPETFVYGGHSYVYYYTEHNAPDGTENTDIYITSLETQYKHLKVSGTQFMKRFEPEVGFPSSGAPIIFFSADGADGQKNGMWRSAVVGLP